ncbi:MAG: hypothetical protein RIK85_17825 [Marinobacter sp.]
MAGQGVREDEDSRYEGASEESPAPLTEEILTEDRQRLNNQIESLAPERPGETDVYFLAVGGRRHRVGFQA